MYRNMYYNIQMFQHLRGVGKIAKLRFPNVESVGILVRVAKLKAKHCIL